MRPVSLVARPGAWVGGDAAQFAGPIEAARSTRTAGRSSVGRPVDLIEDAAFGEMRGLCLGPAAEVLVDLEKLKLGETRDVGGLSRGGIDRAEDVLRRQHSLDLTPTPCGMRRCRA